MTTLSSKIDKVKSVALLLLFSLHSFGVRGFADSLIYCFESNGDINIESISPFSLGFKSDCDLHENHSETSNEVEYHSGSDFCNDVEFSDIYFENNRTNRLDKESTFKVFSRQDHNSLTAPLTSDSSENLSLPIFKPIAIKSIQSVILII